MLYRLCRREGLPPIIVIIAIELSILLGNKSAVFKNIELCSTGDVIEKNCPYN